MSSKRDFGHLQNDVLLAIPALNEEDNISQLLFDINAEFPFLKILVVDDGSVDKTSIIAQSFNCNLVKHPTNMGKGASIKSALKFAFKKNYKWLITIDGDNQHPPKKIHQFLELIEQNGVDLIIASRRDRRGKMPFHRQLSNGLTSIIISLLGGTKRIQDSQCGFRAYKVGFFRCLNAQQLGFHYESEMLIKALRAGLDIKEFDIDTIYSNQKSSIKLVKDTCSFVKLIFKSIINF